MTSGFTGRGVAVAAVAAGFTSGLVTVVAGLFSCDGLSVVFAARGLAGAGGGVLFEGAALESGFNAGTALSLLFGSLGVAVNSTLGWAGAFSDCGGTDEANLDS